MSAPDVAVVGGGFAGLSAAVALAAAGARVVVLEARPSLGGRATAFIDPESGEVVDNGQHAFFGCYHETFRFLRAIGTDGLVQLEERLDIEVIDRERRHSRLRSSNLPPPLHLVGGLLRWDALSWRDRIAALALGPALLRAARAHSRGDSSTAAVSQTVDEWLRGHGQTTRLRELLWEPLAVAALNQPPSIAQAATFVRVLGQMFGGTRRDSAVGIPRVPLDALYAKPAARWLAERRGQVRTSSIAEIVCDGERVAGVQVRGEPMLPVPSAVCAVPWHALERTIAGSRHALEGLLRSASAMQSLPIVTVNLWFDRPVTEVPYVGLPGRVMQWVFDKRQAFGEAASHLSLVSSGADVIVAKANRELIDLALGEVRDALPASREATLLRALVVREKRATFSLAPGQPSRPQTVTPVRGLFLAGDWIDTGLPATIESAVVSGHRAAAAVRAM
jgi:squalene-associated FAD-dependent desaturase